MLGNNYFFTDNLLNMFINIKGSVRLKDIAHQFNRQFPFLQLGFYYPDYFDVAMRGQLIDPELTIVEAGPIIKDDLVEFHYWQQTGEVEKLLSHKIGLNVQVLRKYHTHWIRTEGSDILSLEEQNDNGRQYTIRNYSSYLSRFPRNKAI